ncbi:sorbin and SH3 domain-containing protein 1-like isoform X12 [Anopheles albimanus]|uniref:sorbin and SH3 domain-containing protein 1-like isoform X12 n=1 Tax=Anopheles albimanus TaxID=7167 RepID=UPI001640B30F|nr:sorbin and SH3 domain-containing protein 1-like isoform X12 [Anopheles albimanus]
MKLKCPSPLCLSSESDDGYGKRMTFNCDFLNADIKKKFGRQHKSAVHAISEKSECVRRNTHNFTPLSKRSVALLKRIGNNILQNLGSTGSSNSAEDSGNHQVYRAYDHDHVPPPSYWGITSNSSHEAAEYPKDSGNLRSLSMAVGSSTPQSTMINRERSFYQSLHQYIYTPLPYSQSRKYPIEQKHKVKRHEILAIQRSGDVLDKAEKFGKLQQSSFRYAGSGKPDTSSKTNGKIARDIKHISSGVWSPFNRSTEVLTKEELAERTSNSKVSEPLQPVWVPRSAPPSPAPERREFRPIGFESPTPSRRALASPSPAAVAAPWTQPGYTPPLAVSDSKLNPSSNASSSIRCGTSISTPSQPQGYGQQVRFAPQPRSAVGAVQQEPTINSLLKSKDGKVAVVEDAEMAADRQTSATTVSKRTTSSNQQHQLGGSSNRTASPAPRTGYSSSGARNEGPQNHQMQQMVHKVAGIGPTTREGMPLTLRSEIEEGNRDKWYKQMYQTLHKAHDDDDYVTVRYKTRKGYPYKSSGYQSEPEPNYDSDYTIKYSTLDRRRTPIGLSPTSYNKFNTQQQTTQLNQPIKSGSTSYKNHPGRIENYTPGRSSISEKESKAWWDEVMDIFNGQLEHQKLTTSKTYTEGNLSRALKEQGYESDSTLVFRKREPLASAALSPVEQKQYYKTMQAGGEIPLQGFRKPAPEKPKEPHLTFPSPPMKGAPTPPPPPIPLLPSSPIAISSNGAESPRRYIESDVNIHYKTPIRFEYKEPIPDDELAYRQAEHMRRVYQEERRRKYINELEDMHSRRHADNILPSQKSPIPLNRYDDFAADLSPKPLQQQQPKTIARALYNFQGQSIRELSFRKGDIIYLRRQIDKNWYEGEHNATVGLLPANYIEILTKDNVNLNAKPLPRKPTREGKARAKFNFTAQTAVELSLLKGELVTLTRRVDENWFEGKIGSKKGIFPVSYVEILTDIDGAESYEIEPIVKAATQSFTTHYGSNGRISPGIVRETKTVQKTEVLHVDTSNEPISYRALYNYKPQNTDELELHEGDIVYVLEKCDDGWYVGTSARTGCFGTFPGNYVNKL